MEFKIIKKDGRIVEFNPEKIISAVAKSAERVMVQFSEDECRNIIEGVTSLMKTAGKQEYDVPFMHQFVECVLDDINPKVAKSYREYRNYKQDFVSMFDKINRSIDTVAYRGDKSNSNTDSKLVTTQRSIAYGKFNDERYKKFFLNQEERQAAKDGYIYIHDRSARLDSMNCCLLDIKTIFTDGFELGNIPYTEPHTVDVACDVLGDVIMAAASSQYGGLSVRIDDFLPKYCERSYRKYIGEYTKNFIEYEMQKRNLLPQKLSKWLSEIAVIKEAAIIENMAYDRTIRELEQGLQGLEIKLNSVASSRGDYPFVSFALGLDFTFWGKEVSKTALRVRMNGQGKEGFKKPVLFPKLIFLYDERLHGKNCKLEDVFNLAIECSSKSMYPDFLSLTGEGYVPSVYKKYRKVVFPMGCVDKQEIITYRLKDRHLHVESFERMWRRLSRHFEVQKQKDDRSYYMDLNDVEIYDHEIGFVTCKRINKNEDQKDWVQLIFSNGRQLMCTEDHPLPVINKGRTLVKNITVGDEITPIYTQYSEQNSDFFISEEEAWLYGVILCDGCYDNQLSATFANTGEDDIIEKYQKAITRVFGLNTVIVERKREQKGYYKEVKVIGNSKHIQNKLGRIYGGVRKAVRQIPNEVFSCSNECKLAFLAGMIDADGYLNSTDTIDHIQIGSTNKELALQTLALAQSIGYKAKVYLNKYNKYSNGVRYRIEFDPDRDLAEALACNKKKSRLRCIDRKNKMSDKCFVKKIKYIGFRGEYSYDVTTSSDKFDVSGISSHNCRAFLSPWYEHGGLSPADKEDTPVFIGRFNIGAVTLHLPMILAKARQEKRNFYEVLDYYLELIRKLHLKTYEYLGNKQASICPLTYCEGGFYGGHLKPSDKIAPVLKSATASFGVTALNELNVLYNGKTIAEDGQFPLEVMQYINTKIEQFKKEDSRLYAVYGTPAESLCGLQIKQFRDMYGIVEGVSNRPYTTNSFHCGVWEKLSPIEKQDKEEKFWNLFNGGKIQYVRYPIDYNIDAIKTLVRRAMKKGYYEGINMALSYCDDCGHQELNMEVCPVCGSSNLTKIDRMNGYLSYSRVKGDTTLNEAKMAEIKDRYSM